MNNEKIITGSWLPVFPGFYGTFFDGENMYESEIDYINERVEPEGLAKAMIDNLYNSKAGNQLWKDYEESIAKQCVTIIASELVPEFVESIEFEAISSPREYNFRNDSIIVKYTFSAANLQAIRHFISEHYLQWQTYLKETYTSYDGFISHHANNPGAEEWFADNALRDRHNAGAVMEFICGEKEITSETLYYDCDNDVGLNHETYEKECIDCGWYVPDTWWNRLKSKWADRSFKFKVLHGWGAKQYIFDTKKQRYIFAVSRQEVKSKYFIVKRYFKVFIFARLKDEKKNKS